MGFTVVALALWILIEPWLVGENDVERADFRVEVAVVVSGDHEVDAAREDPLVAVHLGAVPRLAGAEPAGPVAVWETLLEGPGHANLADMAEEVLIVDDAVLQGHHGGRVAGSLV